MNLNTWLPYIFNAFIGIIGFFLVTSYNRTNEHLSQINHDVLSLNKEIVELRLNITTLESKMLTEERVKELIRLEGK